MIDVYVAASAVLGAFGFGFVFGNWIGRAERLARRQVRMQFEAIKRGQGYEG